MGVLEVDKLLGQEPDPLAAAAVNLTQAAGQNPQEHIERRKLSNASGVPAALMDDPEVRERARRDAFARELYLREHPATAGFAANPNNAPLITDDIVNLKDFEDKTRTLAGTARDVGLFALKGVTAMPQAFVGLADIPTGGRIGKALEYIGYKPGEAQDILGGLYSPVQKEANRKVAEAEGVIGKAVAAVQNPSVIAQTVIESLPSMIGGAGLARGGMAGAAKLAPKLATLSPKLAAALGSLAGSAKVAAALGEGAISAGGAAEQIRGENEDGLLTLKQAAAALASGGTTAAFSLLGGKAAEKLGIADVDVLLTGKGASAGTRKALGRRVLEGMAAEGILEELPQSATEQMWQNVATGKPLFQGVDQALVLGAFAGMAMGGGSNIVTRTAQAEKENTALLDTLTAAEASKLKAGLPESFAEFAQGAGERYGLSAVYLQADRAVEVALSQGLPVEQIMPWLEQYGATAEALDTAIQTGGTIALDYGKVAANFSTDPVLQALKEDFMVSPSGVSKTMAAEADQVEEAHLEKLNDLFAKEQDLKIGQEDVQAWTEALLATPGLNGRVTPESLLLLTARANALTALTGKPAIEHLNRMLEPTGLTTMKLKDFRELYGSAGEEIGQPKDAPSAPEIGRGYSWEAKEGRREIVGPAQGRPAGWWEIKTEGESGSQYIHADDLPGEIEHDVKDAEEWRGIRKAEEAARSREELQRKSYEDTHGFTDSLGDMQKGKVLKALNALVNYEGRPISRKALVETKLSEGWRVSDEGDAIESPDGEFWIPAKKLTKTALDYARYLSGKGFPSEPLAQSDRPFDGPDIAATPLPEGGNHNSLISKAKLYDNFDQFAKDNRPDVLAAFTITKPAMSDKQISDLAQLTDYEFEIESKELDREVDNYLKRNGIDFIDGYHIIKPSDLSSVSSGGLKSSEWYGKDGVYFLADPDDIAHAFSYLAFKKESDAETTVPVVHFRIPAARAGGLRWDSYFNVTFGTYSSFVYKGDIPASDIVDIRYLRFPSDNEIVQRGIKAEISPADYSDRYLADVWSEAHPNPNPEAGGTAALAQSDRPFDGPDIAATPLPEGTTTIEVDGVERPALNSEGRPIHPTVEGVKNFWRWFGDSKVVDSEGRPLVVYHGSPTPEGITEFSPGGKQGSRLSGDAYGVASYFTSSPGEASIYARDDGAVFPVYVRGEILDVDSKLSEVQSDRVSQLASEVMLPSDKARFAIGREVRSFDDVRDARDFFDAQRKNWEAFGDGMDRAQPEARADGGEYQVEFTNFDADVRIETGEDAFTLFKAIGFDNIAAAGFDGLMFARDGGAKWVVMQRPETNVKSATGNRGTFDPAAPSILMQSAWHGSPHTFDKFSTSAIGTGEGAQAYGYGLYFAESKEVAEWYKEKLSRDDGTIVRRLLDAINNAGVNTDTLPMDAFYLFAAEYAYNKGDMAATLKNVGENIRLYESDGQHEEASALNAVKAVVERAAANGADFPLVSQGRLYKVELAPEEDEYLLWDKPLSEQSEKVKAALERGAFDKLRGHMAATRRRLTEDFAARGKQYSPKHTHEELLAKATGKGLYGMITGAEGSDKAASEYLHSLGIRGIKYLDATSRGAGEGSYNYVIFSDDDVAIAEMFQAQTNDPLGVLAIMGDRNLVNLFEKADKSTFLHETAHIFLNDLKFVAETLGVQTAEWEMAKSWLGIGEDGVITRAQHERFAEHFEVYLKNGQAPVPELRSAFRAFKRWLTAIYDNIKSSRYGQRAGITISPEIANLFDHLLATDQEIRAAREQAALVALLDDAMLKDLDASPAQVAEYLNLSTQADDAAREKRDIYKLKDREELRKEWRKQAEAESFEQPVYGFIKAISKLGGINKQTVIDAFGAENLPDHSTLWRTKGEDINVAIAEHGAEFGYRTAADFVEQLRNLKPRNVWVEQRIAQLETLHDNAQDTQEVIRSTAMRRMLDIESVMLSKKTPGAQAIPAAAIKVWAAKTIAGRTIKQINMGLAPLQAQSRRLRQMAILAVRDGRWEDALRFNEQARRTEGLISASMRASKEWTKTKARWKRIAKWTNDNKNVKLGTAFRDQINRLLSQYEIAAREYDPAAPDLHSFVETRATGNPLESDGAVLAEWLGVQTGPHGNLSWERLQDLDDALKYLYGNGREELEGQRTAKGEFVEEIAGAIANSMNSLKPKRELWSDATAAGRAARAVQQKYRKYMAHTGILRFICQRMDGYAKHGLAQQQHQEILNGMARENDLWASFSAKLEPIIARLTKDGGKVFTDLRRPAAFVDHGVNLQWTKKRVVCACLNMGNASNLQRLRDGFALSDEEIRALAGKLTASEWQDIQAIWDTINELWPMIADVHERINYFRPKKIEPLRFRIGTADGLSVSLAGGYYPVGYDIGSLGNYDLARWSERDDILNSHENTRQVPVAKSGMTKARADKTARPLDLSFDVLGKHLHDSIRYIALAEAVRDTDRIFNNKELRAAAYDTIGSDLYGMIRPTLMQVLRPNQTELGRYEWLRTKTSVFYMAWNAWTAIQNLTGVFPAIFHAGYGLPGLAGYKNYGAGMAHVAANPYHAYKAMLELSGYMRLREGNIERDMQSQLKQLASGGLTWKEVEEKFADAGFLPIRAIDTLVSLPTWWGVYNDQMRQHGNIQSAIEAADTAVNKAIGSGLAIDQTGIGRSWWRLLAPFMSFASPQQEVLRTEWEALRQGKISVAEYLHANMMVCIFPAMASTFLSGLMMYGLIGAVGGGDDDDKRKKTVGDYFTDVISYRLMGLPFVRDVWNAYLQGVEHKQPITAARMPFTEFFKLGQQAFYRLGALDGDSEKSQKALAWTLAEMVSYASGLPVTRVYDKWRRGQEDIENREGWWMNHLVPQERKK